MPKKKDGGAVRVDNLSDRPFYLAVGDFCDFFFVGRDADGEGFVGGDNDWHKAEVTRAADNRLCLEILGVGEEVNVKLDLGAVRGRRSVHRARGVAHRGLVFM